MRRPTARALAAMARKAAQPQLAGVEVDLSAPPPKKSKGPRSVGQARIRQLAAECAEMRRTGRWDEATAGHLVALCAYCHEKVYGVSDPDLVGKNYGLAQTLAGKMIRDKFGGDVKSAVDFVRWTWKRERDTEEWRRKNDKPGRRIGFRLQFGASGLYADWRLDVERKRK